MVFGPHMLVGIAAAEHAHPDAAGTATGFLGLFGYVGAALSGYPLAALIQKSGWHTFFLSLIACAVFAILILISLSAKKRRLN